jgi:hypothetical protein
VFNDGDEAASTGARNRANYKHSQKAHAQIAPQAGRERMRSTWLRSNYFVSESMPHEAMNAIAWHGF